MDNFSQVTEEAGGIRLIQWRLSDSVQTLISYLGDLDCLVAEENTLLKSRSVIEVMLSSCSVL